MLLLPVAFLSHPAIAASAGQSCGRHYRQLERPPLVLQRTDHSCGPACIVSLVKQLKGKDLKESHVAALIGTNRSIGTTPKKMVEGLGKLGLRGKAKEGLRLQELKANFRRGKGQILLVESGGEAHWVVLADFQDGRIKLMDPWRENKDYLEYSEKEFEKIWTPSLAGKRMNRLVVEVE